MHALQKDIRRQVQATCTKIDLSLEVGRVMEAWDKLAQWYHEVRERQAHPTKEGLDQVSEDRAELYICWLTEGLQVPLLVHPAAVNYGIPVEAEIYMEV